MTDYINFFTIHDIDGLSLAGKYRYHRFADTGEGDSAKVIEKIRNFDINILRKGMWITSPWDSSFGSKSPIFQKSITS